MEGAPPDTRRLFIGLRVESEVAERLAQRVRPTLTDDDGGDLPGLTLYPARDLHLTLCFLGAVEAHRAALLGQVLREEVRGLVAPDLRLSGTGGFPDLDQPLVLWAGVHEAEPGCGRFTGLCNRVRQAALSVGWRGGAAERGRPFVPHVTLARLRPGAPPIHPAFGRLRFDQRWLPVEVELMESRPNAPDGRYHTLEAVPLVVRPG